MKNWIKFTAASIAIAAIAILSVIAVGDKKTIKSQQERIEEQGKVIDSLRFLTGEQPLSTVTWL